MGEEVPPSNPAIQTSPSTAMEINNEQSLEVSNISSVHRKASWVDVAADSTDSVLPATDEATITPAEAAPANVPSNQFVEPSIITLVAEATVTNVSTIAAGDAFEVADPASVTDGTISAVVELVENEAPTNEPPDVPAMSSLMQLLI